MTLAERFLAYQLAREMHIHGQELIVEFGCDDGVDGPLVYPFTVRLGVN